MIEIHLDTIQATEFYCIVNLSTSEVGSANLDIVCADTLRVSGFKKDILESFERLLNDSEIGINTYEYLCNKMGDDK